MQARQTSADDDKYESGVVKKRFDADGYVGKINELERTMTDGK